MRRLAKILLGLNALALGYLVRGRFQQFLLACRSSFSATRWTTRLPEVGLGEILKDRKPVIRLAVQQYEDGMLPSEQLMVLLSLLVVENPKEVLEVGTFMGHTTRQMAENLLEATIHTVDLPEDPSALEMNGLLPKDDFHLIGKRRVGREFKGQSCANRIVQHFADTATWDFDAGQPTFFFIDGSHTYEYCKSDTEKCLAKFGRKGVFLWHDCDDWHPGVVRYLCECRSQGMDVKRIAGMPIAYWKGT